jgi:hypothetical protein
MIFGKRWLMWDMLQGYKGAIFVNEIEIDMQKAKLDILGKNLVQLENDLKKAEETEIVDPATMLPEDKKEDKQALYEMRRKLQGERAENISRLKNLVSSNKEEIDSQNGEMAKIYSLTYNNRMKYDFLRSYKIKDTYADKN